MSSKTILAVLTLVLVPLAASVPAVELKTPRDVGEVFQRLRARSPEVSEASEPETTVATAESPRRHWRHRRSPRVGRLANDPGQIEKNGIPSESVRRAEEAVEAALLSGDQQAIQDACMAYVAAVWPSNRLYLGTPEQREAYLRYLESRYPEVAKILLNQRLADRRQFVDHGFDQTTFVIATSHALTRQVDAALAAGNDEAVTKLATELWKQVEKYLQTPGAREAWIAGLRVHYPHIAKWLDDHADAISDFIKNGQAQSADPAADQQGASASQESADANSTEGSSSNIEEVENPAFTPNGSN